MRAQILRNTLILIAFISVNLVSQAKKNDVPKAPLPTPVQSAKTIFLANGGGDPLAFDEFYSQMKSWGHFAFATSPDQADIVVELKYLVEDKGTRVWTSTNTFTNQTRVHSREVTDPQLVLDIFAPKSGVLLWSTTDHRRLAALASNRAKETVNSADRLVKELQDRMPPSAADKK